jgi:hypothetical protein
MSAPVSRELLLILVAGARSAAERSIGGQPAEAISMRAWNEARPLIAAQFGWPPLSHELLRQLNSGRSKESWQTVLSRALGEE